MASVAENEAQVANVTKQNRAEKKARKAVNKLGFKPLDGISRVTIKKGRSMLFVVSKPEVFKAPSSETYVVFGEAEVQDMNKQAKAVSFAPCCCGICVCGAFRSLSLCRTTLVSLLSPLSSLLVSRLLAVPHPRNPPLPPPPPPRTARRPAVCQGPDHGRVRCDRPGRG